MSRKIPDCKKKVNILKDFFLDNALCTKRITKSIKNVSIMDSS